MKLKILKTDVSISFLMICLASLCIIMGVFQNFLLCIFAILIHEAGHIFTMRLFGYSPDKIKISLYEIQISDNSRQRRTNKQNFFIIFFGPFANFICFIICYLLYLFCNAIFMPFAIANLSICIFNLLPVLSLDGGQMLYILLLKKHSETFAEKAVNIISFIFLFPLSAAGFLLLFNSEYNFSLLFVCFYIVLSLVCKNNRYY